MSEQQPSPRRLDASQGKEVVFCHACHNEWYREDQPTLECPRCHGEITEIVCAVATYFAPCRLLLC